jgi:hypothetical protein
MAEFLQTPGELNITASHDDDFEFYLTFDINLTGYTFSAQVVTIATNALVPLTVTPINLTLGQIKISLTKATMATLTSAKHHYYLDWTASAKTRRVLAGLFEVIDYP